ncbi:hypothetical protein SEA_TYPHA_119 [Mycobacterium phage Typha]|uniref:Uncharacterized protein n=1 Tax=Mycobacterium phage Typha TaxID=2517971 RepID=A0A482JAQ2_9CAUD|nr:hypothetical protein KCH40_gp050 [Mycobacterium phage Typha]QBP29774.1 hypothetical protein SEA_TYPHA_119 [Mycobacterium phage Typha]URM86560.1 hypothetical protein PBI_HILLTOPFARM_122 [Mycobacterium phage Hilltopfarm]
MRHSGLVSYTRDMTNTIATQDLTPGTRVRLIGSPAVTGTLVGYFKPLHGRRRVNVKWDRELVANYFDTQVEAI